MAFLSQQEILAFKTAGNVPKDTKDLSRPLREALDEAGHYQPAQIAGRNFAIACVALEVTQRCNLDCTLCYLSDLAEAVRDVPLFELERRIEIIHRHYGDHTTIQITGGDPTLRSIPDLVAVTKMIKSRNMRAALFTNGIKASRKMLIALAEAGLDDVVYHVDLTQERKGFESEIGLNKIRMEYIEKATGLPIRVLFNTTVFDGNFHEIPALVSFFCDHADRIDFCSFQMQADTGRGVLRKRDEELITQQSVMAALRKGTRTDLSFDHPMIGHPECNKYAAVMVCGDKRTNLFDDQRFFSSLFARLAVSNKDWSDAELMTRTAVRLSLRSPALLFGGLKFWLRKLWQLRGGLARGKRINRLNFFIHNFMDAENLERSRCESCVFMVATADGPLSMCVHNAKRDQMITRPVRDAEGTVVWDPLGEKVGNQPLPFKKMKGRMREQADNKRKANRKEPDAKNTRKNSKDSRKNILNTET